MAKKEAKKKFRLRKRVRKTAAAICLITAILVAAIPVPQTKAAGETEKYTWENEIFKGGGSANSSVIPVVPKNCDTIYTTGDGTFQFAFVNASSTSLDKIAVILGYKPDNLANNYLEIPSTVDAYTKYNENRGSKTGYVAVSRNQKPLYYMAKEAVYEVDVSGNDVLVKNATFKPCYYADSAQWDQTDLANFYYRDSDGTVEGEDGYFYTKTETTADQWIKNITVMYIGNQSLVANPAAENADGAVQAWVIAEDDGKVNTDPDKGVFANESNIHTLVVGENLMGIGNYAFYGCASLDTIKLGNGLSEIGHHAFADCVNMKSIDLDFNSRLQYISDYTFANCRALESFQLPVRVSRIFDHAFDGCTSLGNTDNGGLLDISGIRANMNVVLSDLGISVFRNCTSLTDVRIPDSVTGTVDLSNFAGCSNLRRILVKSSYTNFEGTITDDELDFKSWVSPIFYFECVGDSATHEFTKAHAIPFKYADQDKYEVIIREKAVDGSTAELTYQVNSKNELLYFNMNKKVKEVTIPERIGPYGISAISEGSFSDNCFLEKITIPATVTQIKENAFRGCHNLKDVLFQNATEITYIGDGAFDTQIVQLHANDCTNKNFLETELSPVLRFTGTIGNNVVPFNYAMNSANNINAGQQTTSYITYYSGWPTNLEVKYVKDKETGVGKATLVDYPVFNQITTKYTQSSYPYITEEYERAAREAVTNYNRWLSDKSVEVTDDQWDIINAALTPHIPTGVKAIWPGLFSNTTSEKDANGNYYLNSDKTVRAVKCDPSDKADEYIQEITFEDIDEFEPYTFNGCKSLKRINITGGTAKIDDYAFAFDYVIHGSSMEDTAGSESNLTTITMPAGGSSIGDYAFNNNPYLKNVILSPEISEMGIRPFRDCPTLENVDFQGGPYFITDKAIIYGLENGEKSLVVQCLESRGKLTTSATINPGEMAGVKKIAEEAFMDCEELGQVDLSQSKVTTIPENAFRNTKNLYSVILPTTCKSISKYAFHDSGIRYADIPSSVSYIDPLAFNTPQHPSTNGDYRTIQFYCEPGSAAEIYADEYENINVTEKPSTETFTVTFWNYDGTVIVKRTDVLIGTAAEAPEVPERPGYRFTGWQPSDFSSVSRDMDIVAQYEKIDSEEEKFTVNFIDYDDKVLYVQKVAPGEDAIPPQAPTRTGYVFTGWRPAITNIQKDTDVYAQYEKVTDSKNNNNKPGSGGGNNTNNTLYTLTVKNGSGSGSYVAGSTVIIIANETASTQQFSKWTTENENVKFASATTAATTVVMPSENLTVTANYVAKSNSGSSGGSNGNNSGNSNNSGNGSGNSSVSGGNQGGSVVVIDKNGLSNTGVVSVTVKGSSDNFVLKVTEDSAATEAVVKALMNEYGSLDNLKYFPMDISLYDSTGKNKITDTTGLSISITLPLPDSLIEYAGNNKVAGVVGEKLDKLSPKFTTIDGVACVTFKAEHFSPYVIYVNTSRLEANGVTDSSPKTGDIHPKWFFVIGLTCMSLVLFFKKDKRVKKVTA